MDNTISHLGNLVAYQIKLLLESYNVENIEQTEIDSKSRDRLLDHLSLIIISSEGFEVVFKLHFTAESAANFWRARFEAKANPGTKQIIDWLKEFCNLVAGKFKQTFESVGIETNHSIPFYLPGYVDYFFKSELSKLVKIQGGDFDFIFSAMVRVEDKEKFAKVNDISNEQIQDVSNSAQDMDDYEL